MAGILPEIVERSMRKLYESLQNRIQDTVVSVYVYGSTALNAFIEGSSDIDFLVFVNRKLTPSDIRLIEDAHKEVEPTLFGLDIMGAYIRQEDAGKSVGEIPPVPTYFDRKMQSDGDGDLNPITWWLLQRHGICVHGQRLSFDFEISSEALIQYVIENMNSYWAAWIARLEQNLHSSDMNEHTVPVEQLDFAVEWCTLGMLRQFYTIREHGVTSKIAAGEYGLTQLPERWHGLIREAIAIKRREDARQYASQLKRLHDLVELLRLIHTESNASFQKQN
ncbi:nucleotidyltransferase domain-containing protein [Paenibacillus agaridevorans]|uniref:nucleotidyltransferase domain-containing protein n=1 Tax=Paenibacillus agaridevorans TaxID=171404 RepID=UPI001BE43C7F|nr:aminoglycoside adenylyltransferase domain-containing protein [Paenibacillus agaridevorans]